MQRQTRWLLNRLLGLTGAALFFGLGFFTYPILYPAAPSPALVDAYLPARDPADMQIFWEVWHYLDKEFYGQKPSDHDRIYGAIQGLAHEFGDEFTAFYRPPEDAEQETGLTGVYGDIGADLEQTPAGYVLRPLPAQNAANAGILTGDILVAVDEQPVSAGMSLEEVQRMVWGAVDSQVRLTVERRSAGTTEQLTFEFIRMEKHKLSMTWRLLDEDPATATVGYIRQESFSERSVDEMRVALAELTTAGADRILLDLRDNPGGYVEKAVSIADMWLDEGVLLIERYADGNEKTFEAQPGGEAVQLPLTVIVNGGTASAGEILAGALQAHGRAQLVGEQTYGKGSVQLRHEFPDDSALHVTHALWFAPNHRQISKVGLTPDIVIEPGVDPLPEALVVLAQVVVAPARSIAGRQ